jgi:hypothetical protein
MLETTSVRDDSELALRLDHARSDREPVHETRAHAVSGRGIVHMPLHHNGSRPPLATEEQVPSHLPALPVLLGLQYLRGQTHGWHARGTTPDHCAHELPDVLASLQRLAIAAQAAGLSGFAGLCQRVSEQFERLCPEGRISNSAAQLFVTWTLNADRYLRKPASRTLIATLVAQLGVPQWPSPLAAREQDRFIQEMLAPFA